MTGINKYFISYLTVASDVFSVRCDSYSWGFCYIQPHEKHKNSSKKNGALMYNLNDRILGCLTGAGAGDAMGAATEARTTEQIKEYFGHTVTDFEITPMDTFAKGNQPGQATDDFSSAYFITRHIIDSEGEINAEVIRRALIDWSEHAVFFDRFAGPTTRMAIKRFKGEPLPQSDAIQLLPRQATNGAAMKISPIGLFNAGDVEKAISEAAMVTAVTHDTYLAISGGCATAAAVAEALKEDADVYSVIGAGLYGAREGERIGREIGRDVAGPSVIKRIEMAVNIGLGSGTLEEKMKEISDRIGTGLHIAEAVPSAFGLFAAGEGNAMDVIISAVNAGYDTDTLATIAGAMAGALCGAAVFPAHFVPTIDKANGFDLKKNGGRYRTYRISASGSGCKMNDRIYDKIAGCILAAAVGDAMGAATEAKSTGQIIKLFGGRVTEFKTPPADVQARGRRAGQVTDAFSIPYMLTDEILKAEGRITKETAGDALLKWGDTEYFEPFAGLTTKKAVMLMNEKKTMSIWDHMGHLGNKLFKGHYYALSSNGAAVKAYTAGIFSGGDVEKAVMDAMEITVSSHDDPYSISGACAVAAAVSEALGENATVYSIVKSAQYGCIKGEELGRARKDIHVYPGPSVVKRLEMAIEAAIHAHSGDNPIREIRERIGSGPAIAETVPAAIGIFIVNRGRTMECIYDGVNIGDETSAVASIAGALCGAFRGVESITDGYLDIINKENGIDIEKQARAVFKTWKSSDE